MAQSRRVWEVVALNLALALPPGVTPAHLEWAAMLVRLALLQKLPQGIQAMLLYRSHVCGMRFMNERLDVCWRASLFQQPGHETFNDAMSWISAALRRAGNGAMARAVDDLADCTDEVQEEATGHRDRFLSDLRELCDNGFGRMICQLGLQQLSAANAVRDL